MRRTAFFLAGGLVCGLSCPSLQLYQCRSLDYIGALGKQFYFLRRNIVLPPFWKMCCSTAKVVAKITHMILQLRNWV